MRTKLPGGGEPCRSRCHPPSRESRPRGSTPSPVAGSHGHLPRVQPPHGASPCKRPSWRGVPTPNEWGHPLRAVGSTRAGALFLPCCLPAGVCREGLPAQAAEQLLGGFCLAFFFFPLSLSWKLIVHFQQQPGDPGDNSADTQPGTGTTWTCFRHLASHKEGGRQRGSIPSAPTANKPHRLTPVAAETCRSDLGFSRSHGDKLLHVFLSLGRWFSIPLCLLPRGEPWGEPPFAPSLRCPRPNPPGAHTGTRGPRNLPAPLGSLLGGDKH